MDRSTANTSHNPIETHIISAFVPLEMLSWLILVEYKRLYSNNKFNKNFSTAEAQLAELLRVTGIPNDLPKYMQSLLASSSDQNLVHKDLSDKIAQMHRKS